MKKIIFFLLLIYFLSSFKVYAIDLIPQPSINCGVGTDSAVVDFNNNEFKKYHCCYSPLETINLKIFNPFRDFPLLKQFREFIDFFGGFTDFFNEKIIRYFPFIIWPFVFERPGSLENFIEKNVSAVAEYYRSNRCGRDSVPIGVPGNNCYCKLNASPTLSSLKSLCDLVNDRERESCYTCIGFNPRSNSFGEGGVYTSIGCIKNSLSSFIKENLFGLSIGLAGTVALICIIYSAFILQTSSGNPEKIKKAQEILTSCIMGLMLIIFSIFILKVIGVDILRIPGFGK